MKVTCEKCGYNLEIEDKLLLEASLDFSCPNCQNPVKVESPSESKRIPDDEDDDSNRTEIFSTHAEIDDDNDATVLKPKDDEVTINNIADNISEVRGEILEAEDSVLSLISELKEKADHPKYKPDPHPSFNRNIRGTSNDRTELIGPSKLKSLKGQKITIKEKSGLFEAGEPKQLFDPKKHPHYETSLKSTGKVRILMRKTKKEKVKLALIALLVLFILITVSYPYFSLKNIFSYLSMEKIPVEINETLAITSLYKNFDTANSLIDAKNLLLEELKDYPKSPDLLGDLAIIYSELGKTTGNVGFSQKALEISSSLIAKDKFNADAYRALSIYSMNDPDKAAFFLDQAISSQGIKNPKDLNPENYYIQANIEISTGNLSSAERSLQKALSIDPDYLKALRLLQSICRLNNPNKNLDDLDARIVVIEEKFYNAVPELKNYIVKAKKPKTSKFIPTPTQTPEESPKETTKAAIKRTAKPTTKKSVWELKIWQGKDYFSKSQYLEAEKEFKQGIEEYKSKYPTHKKSKVLSKFYTNLGYTYIKLYRTDNSLDSFKSAVAYDPSNYDAHKGLANLYEELGENSEAAKEYESYLKYK